MHPRRRIKGWLARAVEGLEPKTVALVILALVGGGVKSSMDSGAVREDAAAQVAQVENRAEYTQGKLEDRVDSLRRRVAALERTRVVGMKDDRSSPMSASAEGLTGPPAPRGRLLSALRHLWPFGGRG